MSPDPPCAVPCRSPGALLPPVLLATSFFPHSPRRGVRLRLGERGPAHLHSARRARMVSPGPGALLLPPRGGGALAWALPLLRKPGGSGEGAEENTAERPLECCPGRSVCVFPGRAGPGPGKLRVVCAKCSGVNLAEVSRPEGLQGARAGK